MDMSVYHEQCVNAIEHLIEIGEKRITSLIPAGAGMSNVLMEIAKLQMNNGKRVAILAGTNKRLILLEQKLIENGICYVDLRYRIEQLRCLSLSLQEEIRREGSYYFASDEMANQYDTILLYEISPFLRYKLKNVYGKDRDTVIVSFSSSPIGVEDEIHDEILKSMVAMSNAMMKSGKLEPLVFATGNIFDIRDIYGASAEEQKTVLQNAEKERNRLAHSISTIVSKREAISTDDSKTEELKRELEVLKRKVEFQEALLAAIGISRNDVEQAFSEIEALRESIKTDMYDAEGNLNESVVANFETRVASTIVELTKRVLTIQTKEYYETILIGFLGDCVWNERLSEASKKNLIAARMNYDAMMQMEDKNQLDFSGVCLLLTKTMDIEMSKRFYLDYIEWLKVNAP